MHASSTPSAFDLNQDQIHRNYRDWETGIISESLSNADPFPKIWIEDGGADDWSNKDDNGLDAFVNLHVGSQKEGTKEIRGLMDKCHSALHNVDLVLECYRCYANLFGMTL